MLATNSELNSNINSPMESEANLTGRASSSNWSNIPSKHFNLSAGTDGLAAKKKLVSLTQCSCFVLEGKGLPGDSSFLKLHDRLQKLNLNTRDSLTVMQIKKIDPVNSLAILIAPQQKFTMSEFEILGQFLAKGGSMLYLAEEGGDARSGSNFNYFLEERGLAVNNDSVIRTSFSKYPHPKEALVTNGILNREVIRAAGKRSVDTRSNLGSIPFVYAYGASLEVQLPNAIPILGTGSNCLPVNRPVGAVYDNGVGRLCVVGSASMFSDRFISQEENSKLFDVLVGWCLTAFPLNAIDASEPEIADYHQFPNIPRLSEKLKCCLQESNELPPSGPPLFAAAAAGVPPTLFGYTTSLVPKALKLYEELNLPYEPLSLISPQLETPLPPLEPATFQPRLTDLPGPQLELFDLDDAFASEKTRLAMLTNKCNDADLEYYIREAASVLGISLQSNISSKDEPPTAKEILLFTFKQILRWKKR